MRRAFVKGPEPDPEPEDGAAALLEAVEDELAACGRAMAGNAATRSDAPRTAEDIIV